MIGKLKNITESISSIVNLTTYETKEYAKAAIRDIFIQMPSRSVTYENWNGFKNQIIGFFGMESFDAAMKELLSEGWLSESETRYEWKKCYPPVNKINEHVLNEHPDTIKVGGKRIIYIEEDTVAFGYYNGKLLTGRIHGLFTAPDEKGILKKIGGNARDEMDYSGRLFLDSKIMSFWKYPNPIKLKAIIHDLEKKLKIKIYNNDWKIEVIPSRDGIVKTSLYNASPEWDNTILIPVEKFESSYNPEPVQHTLSPLDSRKKKIYNPGFGSEKRYNLDKKYYDKIGSGYHKDDIPQFIKHQLANLSDSIIKNQRILESPDIFEYNGKIYTYHDEDAISFAFDDKGKIHFSPLGKSHSFIDAYISNYDKSGRLWLDSKIVSFWSKLPPSPSEFREIAKKILDKKNINILEPGWKVEYGSSEKYPKFISSRETAKISDAKIGSNKRYKSDKEKLGGAYHPEDVPQHVAHQLKYTSESILTERSIQSTVYGCLMLIINFKGLLNFGKKYINKEDIYNNASNDFGYEKEAHVTILYGFKKGENLDKIKKIIKSLKNPIKVMITDIDMFAADLYDVVYFKAESAMLHKLNKILKDNFKTTNLHKKYSPHLTIAYVKKGTGKKYIKHLKNPMIFSSKSFKYSYPDGRVDLF